MGGMPVVRAVAVLLTASLGPLASACSERVENLPPVGGAEASVAEQQRFVRRLHLDLTGKVPSEAEMTAAIDALAAGNTPAVRRALAADLIASPAFAETWIAELENRLLGGESPAARYNLLCGIARASIPACIACAPSGDPCANCACEAIQLYAGERATLDATEADVENGTATAEIEALYGGSYLLRGSFGDPAALTDALFTTFIARPAEPDERRNGAGMVQGGLLSPTNPAGVLFHRHGSSFADLVDIVFTSEAYREGVVERVFQRYLGRSATPAELAHFSALLDESAPDARVVIEAVVASREYFAQ